MTHQQLQDRMASRGGAGWEPPPLWGPNAEGEASTRQAPTTGRSPGHTGALPRGPLALPCLPEPQPEHAFGKCLLNIPGDHLMESKLTVTVSDTPGHGENNLEHRGPGRL